MSESAGAVGAQSAGGLAPLPAQATPGSTRPVAESMHVLERFSLHGRTALVTGASRGLGRAMARALGQAGARVAVTARDVERAEATAEELAGEGIQSLAVGLEVTDTASVDRAVETVVGRFGSIDVLINNAGGGGTGTVLDAPEGLWRDVMAANVDGTFYVSRAVAPHMVSGGRGSIINVGSMSADIVNLTRPHVWYGAAKAAVHQLTRGLAAEWAEHGIRVNAMAPGYFLTELSPVDQPQFVPTVVEPTPLKRWGEPHELGPLAVYLASDASSFMTGSVLTIDGGYTIY